MAFNLENLVRPNILRLKPYSSARSEFTGAADVFLDANENAFGSPAGHGYNRYPDPLQKKLKERIGDINRISPSRIFVGNGSDEPIDLLFRIFCEPGQDEAIVCPPTYGMYRVSADINNVSVSEVRLNDDFQLDVPAILDRAAQRTKIVFICSPNNPTGNLMRRDDVLEIARNFGGVVVVDEAYIHFAQEASFTEDLVELPNLVVLQTFSKAWAMAGLRVGLAFASEAIVDLMNRVKPPYNVSAIAQRAVLDAMDQRELVSRWVENTLRERTRLVEELTLLDLVRRVFPSDANFILVKLEGAEMVYRHLIEQGIVVRDRSNVVLCEGCLRITVGTPEENSRLLQALGSFRPGESVMETAGGVV